MSYSNLELNGKIAVVIGGTSGIGRAIANGLADAGADVIPTSRRAEQVEVAATEIEERGRRSLRMPSDVSDRDSLQRPGGHTGQLRRANQARSHSRLSGRRLERHH